MITEPMPSMPLFFWNDPDGERYRESYFEMFPGVWRHGDWLKITSRGTGVIYGRSDSTINRQGIRMGTSEIYSAVEAVPEVLDSLVLDIDDWMPLFVVTRSELTDDVKAEIRRQVRARCSPRHVPDEIVRIDAVPRTLSGKKLEVPVKKILMGADPEKAASRDSLANPEALDWFVDYASSGPIDVVEPLEQRAAEVVGPVERVQVDPVGRIGRLVPVGRVVERVAGRDRDRRKARRAGDQRVGRVAGDHAAAVADLLAQLDERGVVAHRSDQPLLLDPADRSGCPRCRR